MTDAMVIVAASDAIGIEPMLAPAGFLYQKITMAAGAQLTTIDPVSKQNLIDGTHTSLDNADYNVAQTDEIPSQYGTNQLFQYILSGEVLSIRLPSAELNQGRIEYTATAGHHNERGGTLRLLWPGFMQYTAVVDSEYICVTMPDDYECHVQDTDEGAGYIFPIKDGVYLRVVV